jgi:hypothetical protein
VVSCVFVVLLLEVVLDLCRVFRTVFVSCSGPSRDKGTSDACLVEAVSLRIMILLVFLILAF